MDMINIEQFSSVNLVVGKIVSADSILKSDKMLKLEVDIGEEKTRTILSGIKKYYDSESLVGVSCIIVKNLEPRSMLGFESHGMLVCVSYIDSSGSSCVRIVEPPKEAPIGSSLS